ncbi:hypothetical protein Q8A73_012147 [Channa argus]|nr:hypothetical protein Q8A73_012147 [Channa argus]
MRIPVSPLATQQVPPGHSGQGLTHTMGLQSASDNSKHKGPENHYSFMSMSKLGVPQCKDRGKEIGGSSAREVLRIAGVASGLLIKLWIYRFLEVFVHPIAAQESSLSNRRWLYRSPPPPSCCSDEGPGNVVGCSSRLPLSSTRSIFLEPSQTLTHCLQSGDDHAALSPSGPPDPAQLLEQ